MLADVRALPRGGPPDAVLPVAIAVTILFFALGSTSVSPLRGTGFYGRWVFLGALLLLAIVALARDGSAIDLRAHHVLSAVLILLALVSTLWSVDWWMTLRRTGSLALLVGVATVLGAWAAGQPRRAQVVLGGVLLGAVVVVLAGFLVYAIHPSYAVQPADFNTPWRFRGLGENPNTVSMLAALGIPLAVCGALTVRDRRARRAATAAVGLLLLAIALSGARGAFLAGLGGGVAAALAVPAPRLRRLAAAVAVSALFGAALVGNQSVARPKTFKATPAPGSVAPPAAAPAAPTPAAPASETAPAAPTPAAPPSETAPTMPTEPPTTASQAGTARAYGPFQVLLAAEFGECKQEDQIGRPLPDQASPPVRRNPFGTSGRARAWQQALDQIADRPVAGYGFGTESPVFFDCFYVFSGSRPENSYLGLLLQLGIVGLVVFLALAVSLVLGVARALRTASEDARSVVAATAGALAAGLVLTPVQSYVYSVGNIATLSLWLCAFVGAAFAPCFAAARRKSVREFGAPASAR